MVKQYRSDGTEIRDGESAVPGYTPFHLREAHAEGEPAPVCGDPDPKSFKWWEEDMARSAEEDIPPVRPELLNAIDPGEGVGLTYLEASENNIDRIVNLIQSHLCHDQDYAPLSPRDQISVLILAVNRIVWTDMETKRRDK